jgi:hypothetical protein
VRYLATRNKTLQAEAQEDEGELQMLDAQIGRLAEDKASLQQQVQEL